MQFLCPAHELSHTYHIGAGAVLDVRSRCFVRGTVLYLPCVFADYDASACVGEDHVLDQRAPLYRACDDLGAAGGRLLGALAGRGASGPVELMLGLEQEFYLAPAASAVAIVCALMGSTINIGLRHGLAVYPLLAVAVGLGVDALLRRLAGNTGKVAVAVAGLLLGWQLLLVFRVHPDYIAHFNALAGS